MTKPEIVEITDELRAELRRLKKCSRAGIATLLRGHHSDVPEGLNAAIIEQWLVKTKTVQRDHLEFVMELWSRGPLYINMTPEMADYLECNAMRVRLHMKYAKGMPFGLSWCKVGMWMSGKSSRIKTAHWDYVTGIE